MHRSHPIQLFFAIFLTAAVSSGCGFWRSGPGEQPANLSVADNFKTEVPFETKEPDVFQAEFVMTLYAAGTGSERVIQVARNGAKIRYDYPTKLSFLQMSESEFFLINPEKKIYAKSPPGGAGGANDSFREFLTTKWLNEKRGGRFENLGPAEGLTRYRFIPDGAGAEKTEIIIYFDENLKIPVKQEFYSVSGEQKNLVSATEIRNLKLAADDSLFILPDDFTEVSAEKFEKETRKRNSD